MLNFKGSNWYFFLILFRLKQRFLKCKSVWGNKIRKAPHGMIKNLIHAPKLPCAHYLEESPKLYDRHIYVYKVTFVYSLFPIPFCSFSISSFFSSLHFVFIWILLGTVHLNCFVFFFICIWIIKQLDFQLGCFIDIC